MLYCGKPPKEKYKKTGENIKKHDLPTAQLLIPNSRYLYFSGVLTESVYDFDK